MEQTKPWWRSRTLWGAFFTLLGLVLPNLGVGVGADDITKIGDSFYSAFDAACTFGGLVLTVYGRATADKQLSLWKAVSK